MSACYVICQTIFRRVSQKLVQPEKRPGDKFLGHILCLNVSALVILAEVMRTHDLLDFMLTNDDNLPGCFFSKSAVLTTAVFQTATVSLRAVI